MGDGWLSCLDKLTNTGVPDLAATQNFTLVPNTSYADPQFGVVFSLNDQFVLSIKPLGGTGATTSQSASASSGAATAVTKTP